MEVCCLKMASRCRPTRAIQMDVTRIPTMSSSHDCGSLSRVVMVRKTDQRMINHKTPKADPQCELVTFETIQTYRGHKPDRTVVIKETQDFPESQAQRSPTAQRFLKSQLSSGIQSMTISTSDVSRIDRCSPVRSITPSFSVRQKSPSPLSQKGSFSLTFTDFERDCLKAHNDFRVKHGVSPLKLNKKLCRFAEEWAKIIASRGTPAHRNNSPYGENIFCSWSSSNNVVVKGWEPVEHWYSEGDTHCFGREPSTLKTGHFTQVVWKDSRMLGVGQARNRSGQVFIVANYDPPGNFIGSFAENVLPIISQTPTPRIVINGISEDSIDSLLTDSSREDGDLDRFVNAILRYHNEYRKKHGAPELKLNKNLRSISQDWAETLAREDRFAYRPNSDYGENIYCLWSSDRNAKANPKNVCRSWYDEVKEFNFGVEPKGMFKAGHFSQMVWKSSRELGVGVAKTKKGKVLVVCNYEPRGNVIGQFNANVLRVVR